MKLLERASCRSMLSGWLCSTKSLKAFKVTAAAKEGAYKALTRSLCLHLVEVEGETREDCEVFI